MLPPPPPGPPLPVGPPRMPPPPPLASPPPVGPPGTVPPPPGAEVGDPLGPVIAGALVVADVVLVVLDVLLDPASSAAPQPTANTIAAAPPNRANPVLARVFIAPSVSSE